MEEGKARIRTNAETDVKKDLVPLLEKIINQGNLYALTSLSFKDIEEADWQSYLES